MPQTSSPLLLRERREQLGHTELSPEGKCWKSDAGSHLDRCDHLSLKMLRSAKWEHAFDETQRGMTVRHDFNNIVT